MPDTGKTDMERIGLFSELGYHNIGHKYPNRNPLSIPFNQAAYKGRQLLPGGSKNKVEGLQSGYFDSTFKRILEKEAYHDPVHFRRQRRLADAKKNLGKAFLPPDGDKRATGLGNFYGTILGPGKMEHFSPVTAPKGKKQPEGKNFYTSPGPKGSGYGYVDITIAKYGEHSAEPYEAARDIRRKEAKLSKANIKGAAFKSMSCPQETFDLNPYKTTKTFPEKPKVKSAPKVKPFKNPNPGISPGGCKAGTFNKYPEHPAELYVIKKKKTIPMNSSGKRFQNPSGPKSRPTRSITDQNIMRIINKNNYKTIPSIMA